MRTSGRWVAAVACALGAGGVALSSQAGCSSDSFVASGDAAADQSTADAPVTPPADAGSRPFALGGGGVQLVVTGPDLGLQITPANLADDVDVIDIHQEYYGVPWQSFATGAMPPPEWVAKMDALAKSAKDAGKPIFLSVSMLNGARDQLAAATYVQGGQVRSADWSPRCYDFLNDANGAVLEAAYVAYVNWMVDEFSPRWLDIAVEVNLFFEKCPSAAAGVIDASNKAYDAAKKKKPELVVFPSIQIDHLYGYSSDSCPNPAQRTKCFDDHYAQLTGLKRDRFAMSTYPQGAAGAKPSDLPADWFTRGASRGGERGLISETGWNSSKLTVQFSGGCVSVLDATEADLTAYLSKVIAAAQDGSLDLVDWWSDRDLVVAQLMTDCPCAFDASWCAALDAFRGPPSDAGVDTQAIGELSLKAFGVMGLRAYDGTPKASAMSVWQAARATPWKG